MERIEEKLEHVNKSTPDLPLHRARLRRALLSSKRFEGSSFNLMKRLFPIGLALVLLFTFSVLQKPDSHFNVNPVPAVSAAELVSQVSEQIQALSVEELAALEERLQVPDLEHILSEAQGALDLRDVVIAEETLMDSNGDAYCTVVLENLLAIVSEQSGCASYFSERRPVAFTTADGSSVVMFVEDDLLPSEVFSFSSSTDGNGQVRESTLFFSGEEDSLMLRFSIAFFDPTLSLEQNKTWLGDGLSTMFSVSTEEVSEGESVIEGVVIGGGITAVTVQGSEEQADVEEPSQPQELTIDENGCSSWQSDDGMMGGGGC
ncbi:hypothetical protein IPG41_01800 [Candidatus Peregrinibacteria bacterium]|nr:MAG: hypothetical protein IPG41_01800 [Candidatus Peregrinibacteria bacterium]